MSLARYRAVASEGVASRGEAPQGGSEIIGFCETRFASTILMLQRYKNVMFVFDRLLVDNEYIL